MKNQKIKVKQKGGTQHKKGRVGESLSRFEETVMHGQCIRSKE